MKKTLLLIGCLITVNFLTAQVSTTSLVAYWPFNGNANDASGNGHNGIVNGATLTNDRFGSPNAAYNFNGNSYIDVPYSSAFAFGTNTDITISAWVKTSGVYNFFKFYLAYDCADPNGGNGFQLGVDNNPMPLYLALGLTSSYNGSANMSDNLWHNLVVVFNRTIDSAKIYNNGAFLAQVYINNSQTYSPFCNPSMLIGGERNMNPQHYWVGDIDDMRIYNRAVTPQEIGSLYAEGTTGINEISTIARIRIYPNPTADKITIETPQKVNVKILNSLCETVYSGDEKEISLMNLASGIYFLQINDVKGQNVSVNKLIKN